MANYAKSIKRKLFLFRFLFIIVLGCSSWAYENGNMSIFYFLIVLFIFLNFIALENFIVTDEFIEIKKYFLFGWITCSWKYNKKETFMVSPEISTIGMDGDYEIAEAETPIGCLLNAIGFFTPSKIIKQNFTIKSLDKKGNVIKKVSIKLDDFEYQLLKNFKENNSSNSNQHNAFSII